MTAKPCDGAAPDQTCGATVKKQYRDNRVLMETIMNGVSTLIALIDPQQRYVFANQAYAAWHGWRQADLLGRHVAEVLSPDLYQSVSAHLKKAMAGRRVTFANRVFFRDGTLRYENVNYDPHLEDGEVTGVFITVIDATARKRAEAALRMSQETLKFVLDRVPVMIWQKDRDGVFREANKAFCDVHRMAAESILGRTDHELFEPWLAERHAASDRRVLQSGLAELGIEDPLPGPDGSVGWSRKDKFPYFDDEGRIVGTIGFGLDITAHKQTQEALRHSEALLEAQNQLKAKNKQLEELNTALNVLLEKRQFDEIQFQERITANLRHLVYPFLEKIERRSLDPDLRALLDAVHFNLEHVNGKFARNFSSVRYGLTPAEIRVADLVRQGHKSKEIAEILGVSYKTVESHREKIRAKLGIANEKKNLRAFLMSME